jgi:hypothetical protein
LAAERVSQATRREGIEPDPCSVSASVDQAGPEPVAPTLVAPVPRAYGGLFSPRPAGLGARRGHPLRWWAAGVAASWLLPLALNAVHGDVLLPLVLLLATAATLRGSRYLLDRLFFAALLLFGSTCAVGMVLSIWPWHLSPVPVAGTALSAVTTVAALRRRRPTLPLRVRLVDIAVPLVAGLAAFAVWWPIRGGRFTDRFAQVAQGGDLAAHFMIYDSIQGAGGYAFMHASAVAAEVPIGYRTYPQGAHFVAALLDVFVRSSPARPAGLTSLSHFLWFDFASVVLLCATLTWAISRIAGPRFSMVLALPLGALAGSVAWLGDLQTVFRWGFWTELVCFSLLVALFAILVRPLTRTREQIVLVAALLVAIAFTYYFALPLALLAVLAWLLRYRRRLRRHIPLTIGAVLVTLGLAPVPVLVSLIAVQSARGASDALDASGVIDPVKGGLLITLALLVIAGLLNGRRRLEPGGQVAIAILAAAGGCTLALGWYQFATQGAVAYYYQKALHLAIITVLVMSGLALRRIVPALGAAGVVRPVLICVAFTVASVQAFNPFGSPVPSIYPAGSPSMGRLRITNQFVQPSAGAMIQTVLRIPDPDRRTTIVIPSWGDDVYVSVWVAVIQRDYTGLQAWRDWRGQSSSTPELLVAFMRSHPGRYQVVTTDPAYRAAITAAERSLDVQLVVFNPNPQYQSGW